MKKIQMVDLIGQYENIKNEIDEAVIDVIRSTSYINGPDVKSFQEELETYLDVRHVIPCANGTDALQIAIMALNLKKGDEIITPSFTYIATVEVIALLGLTPVFVDVNPETFNLEPDLIEAAISSKTKAILPVHLYGQCADMEKIMEIANRYKLYVIEDTAQAIGAEYRFSDGAVKKAGTIGTIGCTSFFPSKNLGCYGDGGAIFTDDDKLAKTMRMIANHGQIEKYYHEIIGVNSRLDSIQAAILRIKLKKLKEYTKARNDVASYYDNALYTSRNIITPLKAQNSTHVFHQYTLKIEEISRDALMSYLITKDIPVNIYYPLSIHQQNAFVNITKSKPFLPVTEELCRKVISLPIHTEFDENQLRYITEHVLAFVENNAFAKTKY